MNWTATDITAFKNAMGQTVNLDTGTLAGTEITAIFTEPFEAVNQFDGSIESSGPSLDCATVDVALVQHNQALRVNNRDYIVTGIQPEGTGWTRLFLRERFD